jgi:hypothetical protein
MKLLVDISRVAFTVTRAVVEKTDQSGAQKRDRVSGAPLWSTQVMALDETGGEMLAITTAGAPPKVVVGQPVTVSAGDRHSGSCRVATGPVVRDRANRVLARCSLSGSS